MILPGRRRLLRWAITVYIRRDVNIPSLEDYHVLNSRMKYTGGVVVYFNGNTVAR